MRLAPGNDLRINSEARIVNEDAAIHFAGVHGHDASMHHGPHRHFEIERDAQVLGEMIQGADRQHAKDLLRAGQFRGDSADCPIAAGGDNDPLAALRCFTRN